MFMFLLGSFVQSSSGLHFGVHLDSILRGRVVIGAIVGARGAPEHLKAGSLYERLFQEGPKEFRGSTGGGPLLHPPPPVQRRKLDCVKSYE